MKNTEQHLDSRQPVDGVDGIKARRSTSRSKPFRKLLFLIPTLKLFLVFKKVSNIFFIVIKNTRTVKSNQMTTSWSLFL